MGNQKAELIDGVWRYRCSMCFHLLPKEDNKK